MSNQRKRNPPDPRFHQGRRSVEGRLSYLKYLRVRRNNKAVDWFCNTHFLFRKNQSAIICQSVCSGEYTPFAVVCLSGGVRAGEEGQLC